MAVWSFQSTIIAFGFSVNPSTKANGVPSLSNGTGEEPVVSIHIPLTSAGFMLLLAITAFTVFSKPSIWSSGCCLNWFIEGLQYLLSFHRLYQHTSDAISSPF